MALQIPLLLVRTHNTVASVLPTAAEKIFYSVVFNMAAVLSDEEKSVSEF